MNENAKSATAVPVWLECSRRFRPHSMQVLQIVSNDDTDHPEDSARAMAARVAAGDLAGPFLHDAEQSAARAYGTTATPEVFLIDRVGVVRYHGAPDGDHDDPAQNASWLREALDDVLAGRAVARPAARSSGVSRCSGGRAVRPTGRPPRCCGTFSPSSVVTRCTS